MKPDALETENFVLRPQRFRCDKLPGWSFELNEDDDSWEAWNPEREFRLVLSEGDVDVIDGDGVQAYCLHSFPVAVVEALRELRGKP